MNNTHNTHNLNGLDGIRKYVTVSQPTERSGHRYYGCKLNMCATCDNWEKYPGLWKLNFYFPIHCYICHSEMFLDDARENQSLKGYEFVHDLYVFCTDCHREYRKRMKMFTGSF